MTRNRSLSRRLHRDDMFTPLGEAFDSFWNEFFNDQPLSIVKSTGSFPKVNVHKTDTDYVLTASCPGMSQDDLDIEITPENVLVLKGRMSEEHRSPDEAEVLYREMKMSAFHRELTLPDGLEGDPSATMKDGVLKLTWKLAEPEPKPESRKISISSE